MMTMRVRRTTTQTRTHIPWQRRFFSRRGWGWSTTTRMTSRSRARRRRPVLRPRVFAIQFDLDAAIWVRDGEKKEVEKVRKRFEDKKKKAEEKAGKGSH